MVTFQYPNLKYYTKLFSVLTLLFMLPRLCKAQIESTSGKDFWLGYGAHSDMFNPDGTVMAGGGAQNMRLYINSGYTATVTVSIPATGWSQTVTVTPNAINTSVVIPKSGLNDARLTGEGVFNKGIHISSNQPISVYSHIYASGSSAATLLIPYEILGQDYYTLGYTQASPEKNSFSYCFVVASDDSTLVEVTPSVTTLNHAAGVPFTQLLQKGQVLNLIGAPGGSAGGNYLGADLTGTRIRTIMNSVGACKKIAVFSGSSSTLVSCSQTGTADNLFQQVLPSRAMGKWYPAVPTLNMGTNLYRILVTNPAAKVYASGQRVNNLINGIYYDYQTDSPVEFSANYPILVAQFITSTGQCGNANGGNGDPEMIYLPAFSLGSVGIEAPGYAAINSDFTNIIIPKVAVDSFSLDHQNVSKYFKNFPGDTTLSYAQIPISPGEHFLHTDTLGFYATVYGYGPDESYGYDAGFYITQLSQLSVKNPYSQPDLEEVCKTVPFEIYFAVKRKAERLVFDFGGNQYLSPNSTVDITNPPVDSVFYSGTDTFYRYKLPAQYTYAQQPDSTAFTVNITMYIYTTEGCIEERTISYTVEVLPKPQAYISLNYNTCGKDTLYFKDSSLENMGYITQWQWNFGNGATSQQQNPTEAYTSYGNYTVKLRAITDAGCYADTLKVVSLNPLPLVNFGYSGLYCPLNNINFTDSSSIQAPWTIASRAWSFGDGTTSDSTNPVKQYAAGGTYTVKLIATSNKNCSDSAFKTITIYPPDSFNEFITVKNPYGRPDSPTACSMQPFNLAVTFTERQQQIQWNFLNNTDVSPNSTVDVTSPVPDSLYGNGVDSFFRYSLPSSYSYSSTGALNIQITAFTLTKGGCIAQTVFNDTVQVVPKPTAEWNLTYDSCANDTLYFMDASSANNGGNIQTWQWLFGDGTGSNVQNPVKKYAAYGDYSVSLNIVTNIGCYADTTKPVSLSPKPVAAFGVANVLFCPNAPFNFTDSSTITSPFAITQWAWSFGDGTTATQQNPATQFANAGTYTVSLTAYGDHNCADTAVKTITIYSTPTVNLPTDAYVFSGTPYQIMPAYEGTGLTYLWAPATALSSDTAAYPTTNTLTNTTYTVTVTGDGGCQANASINIHVEKLITVPNAFSPNGDGINDKWIIGNIEGYPNCTVRIFNRYGQPVFSSVGYNTPWDGTLNGKPLPVGTYYYIIDTKDPQLPGKAGYLELLR